MISRRTRRTGLVALAVMGAVPSAAASRAGATAVQRPPAGPLISLTGGPVVPGGFYRLTIDRDGRATLAYGRGRHASVALAPRVVSQVKRELAAAGFAHLRRDYVHHGMAVVGAYPDRVTYGAKRVTIEPGARAPRSLTRLVADLSAIADRIRR